MWRSQQAKELIHRKIRVADESTKCAKGELSVLWNGQIGAVPRLDHNHMAANLMNLVPAGLSERLDRFTSRDV